jgi:hypothetical protein
VSVVVSDSGVRPFQLEYWLHIGGDDVKVVGWSIARRRYECHDQVRFYIHVGHASEEGRVSTAELLLIELAQIKRSCHFDVNRTGFSSHQRSFPAPTGAVPWYVCFLSQTTNKDPCNSFVQIYRQFPTIIALYLFV